MRGTVRLYCCFLHVELLSNSPHPPFGHLLPWEKVLPVPLKLKKVLVEIAILHYNVNTEEKH
jgi:hypothetical protein